MFDFLTGTFRWSSNVSAYMMFLTGEYPSFSGKPYSGAATGRAGVAV